MSVIAGEDGSETWSDWDGQLIGRVGGRLDISTPALVLDIDAFDENVATLANAVAVRGVGLRPHVKSHKCPVIAHKQVAAGAVGVACATLGEAETMRISGIRDVLLTSPLVGTAKLARFRELLARDLDVAVVVDTRDAVVKFAELAADVSKDIMVLVDLDPGMHRTGATATEALRIAQDIDRADRLTLGGVQAYSGALQHVAEYQERRAQYLAQLDGIRAIVDDLGRSGLDSPIVTGGGTGTAEIDLENGLLNELQPGSYVFMDVEYNGVQLRADGSVPFRSALRVLTTVVSANHRGFVTVDAGLKGFATDGPLPVAATTDAVLEYKFFGDEHGLATVIDGAEPRLGDRIEWIVPHCDPTVNLYDRIYCVRGDTVVDIWPVVRTRS